jgi:hypothetical protein
MQGRSLNGSFDRRWLSLNEIHMNHRMELGGVIGAGMSIGKSYVTGEACWRLVKAPLFMTLSLPFSPLSQYPNNLPLICSITKCLLYILILEKLHPPFKSFL